MAKGGAGAHVPAGQGWQSGVRVAAVPPGEYVPGWQAAQVEPPVPGGHMQPGMVRTKPGPRKALKLIVGLACAITFSGTWYRDDSNWAVSLSSVMTVQLLEPWPGTLPTPAAATAAAAAVYINRTGRGSKRSEIVAGAPANPRAE